MSLLQTFLPEVIPEFEYTRKIAICISDILSFWSTLYLKHWRRYINFKMWSTLWRGDVINDVMNMYLYKCSHNLMILTHRKFNDDIFARFLVITKNIVISFIKEYRGPTLRLPCEVIDDVIIMEKFFWHNLERSFTLFISEVKLKLCSIIQNFKNGCHFELVTNFFYQKLYRKLNISER